MINLLPTTFIAALADSVNPCAFSVLGLTLAFLFSLGKKRREVLQIGTAYIVGIFVVYLLIGLGLLHVLSILGVPRFMSKFGAGALLIWGGLNLADLLIPNFPIKLKIPQFVHTRLAELIHKASLPAAFVLGGLVGLSEFPCTGGPYLLILGLLHDQVTFWQGFVYLLLYNFIFVSPLWLILWFGSDERLHTKVKDVRSKYGKRAEIVGSIILILIGLFILYA